MESNIQNNNYNQSIPQDYCITFKWTVTQDQKFGFNIGMYSVDREKSTSRLQLLQIAFTFSNLEEIYKLLIAGTFQGCGTDYIEIHNKNNMITLKDPKQPWVHEIHLSRANFIEMIETWNRLRELRAAEIYFIQKPDGTILVQKNLDGAHVAEVQDPELPTCDTLVKSFTRSKTESPDKPVIRLQKAHTDRLRFLEFSFDNINNKISTQFGTSSSILVAGNFELLVIIFARSNRWEIYHFLQEPLELFYEDDAVRVHKDRDSIIIEFPKNQNKQEIQLIMQIGNLIDLLTAWEKLIRQDVPKIYFIQRYDGPITVQTEFE
jgi:hypothetical protein